MPENNYIDGSKKKSKKIGIILILAIILIIGLGFVGYKVLSNKEEREVDEQTEENMLSENASDSQENEISANDIEKKKLEDYEIEGTIEIPKTELKCDILNEVTKRSIEIAVAIIYTTDGINQPGNTVILGHSYTDAFFSRNDELEIGDKIYITDYKGNKVSYQIYNKFETTPEDITFYQRTAEMTEGKAEVTLSTQFNYGRLIIQAREV